MQRLILSLREWVLDHWYGQLSLAESFWINCFFVNLGFGILLRRMALGANGVALFGMLSIGVSVWQLVGLWRSACNSRSTQPLWSAVARVICVINVIAFILFAAFALAIKLGLVPEIPSELLPTPAGVGKSQGTI